MFSFVHSGRTGSSGRKRPIAGRIVYRLLLVALCMLFTSPLLAITYTGTNTGAIADGGAVGTCGAPRNVQFNVTGFTGNIGSASVSFTMNPAHTYVGDLRVTLIAPNSTSHLLFSRVGTNNAGDTGDSSNVSGNYLFSDFAAGNIWTAATGGGDGFVVPPANYRTQAAGPNASDSPGPAFTSMNAVFVTVPAASVNGTWTLRFEDCAAQDVGTVSAATLSLIPFAAGRASITGRVMTSRGVGIRNVMVTAYGELMSQPMVTYTGSMGYYRFEELEAGQSYFVTVAAKRYYFEQPMMLVNLDQSIEDMDFVSVQ